MDDLDLTDIVPETQPTSFQLDGDIENIRSQIRDLTQWRSILSSALLSCPSSQDLISSNPNASHPPSPKRSALQNLLRTHKRENIKSTYRLCTGATLFESRDPDPYAVDNGRIIGVRIEAFHRREKKFAKPNYILLNRPYSQDTERLRVHRHTLPPYIPLKRLVDQFLTPPDSFATTGSGEGIPLKQLKQHKQDLSRLVREIRRELISYQRRKEAVLVLQEKVKHDNGENAIREIDAVDAELRELRIDWTNGSVARIRVSQKGDIEKILVVGADGKQSHGPRKQVAQGNGGRMENLLEIIASIVPRRFGTRNS